MFIECEGGLSISTLMSDSPAFFKGWAKPGPTLPDTPEKRALEQSIQSTVGTPEEETLDAISGQYRLFQYRHGHRFSTDDILVAWYGTSWCPSARRVLDLGSGIGSVGMVAAWRLQGAQFVTVEAQEISVRLSRKSCQYNALVDRYQIRQGDFRDAGILSPDEKFDLVLGSPPYFPLDTGIHAEHPQKIACRFEVRGSIINYCEVASQHLEMGGVFASVFPTLQLERVQEAARGAGLSIVRMREIVFKAPEAPLLTLFLMMKMEHLPEAFRDKTWKEPALIIRTAEGAIHPEYSAVKLSIGFPP